MEQELTQNRKIKGERLVEIAKNAKLFHAWKTKVIDKDGNNHNINLAMEYKHDVPLYLLKTLEATSRILNYRDTGIFSEKEYTYGLLRNSESLGLTSEQLETCVVGHYNRRRLDETVKSILRMQQDVENGKLTEQGYSFGLEINAENTNMNVDELLNYVLESLEQDTI